MKYLSQEFPFVQPLLVQITKKISLGDEKGVVRTDVFENSSHRIEKQIL